MDLLNTRGEKCAMVAKDSPTSEDLDDSIVTFGQQNTAKENFMKCIRTVSLIKRATQKKKCHTIILEKQQMKKHILENTSRKGFLQRTHGRA